MFSDVCCMYNVCHFVCSLSCIKDFVRDDILQSFLNDQMFER